MQDPMLNITFVTDYVCPYCYVGMEVLKRGIEKLGIEANIIHQPYELTEEPNKRPDTFHDEKRRQNYRILEQPNAALKLCMKIPPKVIPRPYTRLAHEGWHFARQNGAGEIYSDLIYRAYFVEEENIEDMEVLCRIAEQSGLDRQAFRKALEDGVYQEAEKEAVAYARDVLKITSVPTLFINGDKINLREYTVEEVMKLLQNY